MATHPLVLGADVLHLHWIAGFVSAQEIRRIQEIGKPLVWTLHDQFPMTGGCHYAFGCTGYTVDCGACPQLSPEAEPLPRATLASKRQSIDPHQLIIASPSHWLAHRARQSALFRDARIEVVPNGIDTGAWQNGTREDARAALALPADATVVLTCCADLREERKGGNHFHQALEMIGAARLAGWTTGTRLLVMTMGGGDQPPTIAGFPCAHLGSIAADDPRLRAAYRAADIFVLPTLEDNLPNTMLEAMAAGTPIVAYATGGVPDFVQDGVNGRLVARGDTRGLCDALEALVQDSELRDCMGRAAAQSARQHLDVNLQADRYDRLYAEAREHTVRSSASASRPAVRSTQPAAQTPNPLLHMVESPGLLRSLARLLLEEIRELQGVIATRGGELRDLRLQVNDHAAAIARVRRVCQVIAEAASRERSTAGPSIGIFGTGSGAARVWEAATLCGAEVAWFCDNNASRQGSVHYGRPVIAPSRIRESTVHFVVIGSVHAREIAAQLDTLGVARDSVIRLPLEDSQADLEAALASALTHRRSSESASQ